MAKEVNIALDLLVHVSTIRGFLCKSKEVSWIKLFSATPLTKLQIEERDYWAQKHVCY